jgi:hypothetical protein
VTLVKRLVFVFVLPLLGAALGSAQELPCPEFRVNTSTAGDQKAPAVASDASGSFVVVWASSPPGGPLGIFGQRFDAAGAPRGSEFQVNTSTNGLRGYPSVASSAAGGFVVVWDSDGDGSGYGVFGRRFDASGAPQGPEFRVNAETGGHQEGSSVGADASGNFVVAWHHRTVPPPGTSPDGIFARRFDSAGNPLSGDFQVESYTTHYQHSPHVAVAAHGDFVVVWTSIGPTIPLGHVGGQRYDSAGVPQGGEFFVNSTTGAGLLPQVAFDGGGNFVAVWTAGSQQSGVGVFARRFDPSGTPQGSEFPVKSVGPSTVAGRPHVTFDSSSGVVVVWDMNDGHPEDVFGRRFSRAGVTGGPVFRVNSQTTGIQLAPGVAAIPNRGFVGVWSSDGQDGDGFGVYASLDCGRLYTVTPCRVADTRNPPGLPLAANSTRVFPVAGQCDIPFDARAVAFNVTAVSPSDPGNLRLFPEGQAMPDASAVNFSAGATRANNAVIPLGVDGQIAVRCDMPMGSAGATHLVLDVFGYFKR